MDRRTSSGSRDFAAGAALAIGAAVVAWVARPDTAPLIPPSSCPGVLDAAAIVAARALPATPLGVWLLHVNAILLALSIGAVTLGVRAWHRSWVAAAALGLALALGAAPPLTRAAFQPVLYLVALGTVAATVSPRRGTYALACAGALWLLGSRPCLPSAAGFSPLAHAGPFALGLAVLGGFAILSNGRAAWARLSDKRIPGGLFGLSMIAAPEAAVVSVWLCVAAGLAELLTRAETVRAKAAAVILAALLPALHLPPLHATSTPIRTYGVDRLSADDLRRIVAGLPPDASLAAEDSNVAVLRKTVPPATGSRLYALPWAQSMLMWRGFRLTDAAIDGVSGVAEAHRSSECVRVVRQWRDVTQAWFAGTTVMAFIRDQSAPEHDIVVYVASDGPFRPEVFGDLPTRPWLHVDTYAGAIESERDRLDGHMREDRLASRVDAPPGPFAARLELWRSPDAPGLYPIQIGRTPTRVWVRAMANTDNDLVCASFPREVKDVEIDVSN